MCKTACTEKHWKNIVSANKLVLIKDRLEPSSHLSKVSNNNGPFSI